MGGDQGPRLVVLASLAFLKSHPDVNVTLVGDESQIKAHLPALVDSTIESRVAIQHACEQVSVHEKASEALRNKQNSSMWKAVSLVAEGEADACVSAGNTGALMAFGVKLIGTFEGVRRPAICKKVPTLKGASFLLDLGANINCSAAQLVQFAIMGSALAQIHGVEKPQLALLNIGAEWSKGGDAILDAAHQLKASKGLDFTGFIEGHELYSGKVDVVVCDGLVGNVALKVSEGMAGFVFSSLNRSFNASWWNRIAGWLLKPVLKNWRDEFNPSLYNGAAFLGLHKTVVKSHGSADQLGFEHALAVAVEQVRGDISARIGNCLKN